MYRNSIPHLDGMLEGLTSKITNNNNPSLSQNRNPSDPITNRGDSFASV
jgi:hypothetical protein